MTNIAKNLKALRKEQGLTQEYVSVVTNIPRSSYSGYENNVAEPPLCLIVKLAEIYGVTLDELIK